MGHFISCRHNSQPLFIHFQYARLCLHVQVLVFAVSGVILLLAFLGSFLLLLLSLALGQVLFLVALLLLFHGLLPGVSGLLEQLLLLLLSLLLGRLYHGLRSLEPLVGLLSCNLFVDGLGSFPLQTFIDILIRLELTTQLDLDKFLSHLLYELFPAHLVLLHLEGDVWDDQGDHNLEADDDMFEENAEDYDVAERPRLMILLL